MMDEYEHPFVLWICEAFGLGDMPYDWNWKSSLINLWKLFFVSCR